MQFRNGRNSTILSTSVFRNENDTSKADESKVVRQFLLLAWHLDAPVDLKGIDLELATTILEYKFLNLSKRARLGLVSLGRSTERGTPYESLFCDDTLAVLSISQEHPNRSPRTSVIPRTS